MSITVIIKIVFLRRNKNSVTFSFIRKYVLQTKSLDTIG